MAKRKQDGADRAKKIVERYAESDAHGDVDTHDVGGDLGGATVSKKSGYPVYFSLGGDKTACHNCNATVYTELNKQQRLCTKCRRKGVDPAS